MVVVFILSRGVDVITCPYCSGEMKSGYIKNRSKERLSWTPSGEKLGLFNNMMAPNGVALGGSYSIWGEEINASYCTACRKVIIDL